MVRERGSVAVSWDLRGVDGEVGVGDRGPSDRRRGVEGGVSALTRRRAAVPKHSDRGRSSPVGMALDVHLDVSCGGVVSPIEDEDFGSSVRAWWEWTDKVRDMIGEVVLAGAGGPIDTSAFGLGLNGDLQVFPSWPFDTVLAAPGLSP